jgi:RNA polymerase sigma factor for flagellar operon FliA
MGTSGAVVEGNRLQGSQGLQSSGASAYSAVRAGGPRPAAQGAGTREKTEPEGYALLVAMAPLVKRVAFEMRQHLPCHVEMDDLVGAGTLGLVDALRKFDPSRKVKIESYARHRIRGGILDSLRSLDPATRDLRRRARKVEKAYRDLEAKLGHPAKDEEVAEALGITLKVWHRWAREIHALGFDAWRGSETAAMASGPSTQEKPWMEAQQENPFDLCYRREQRDLLNRALGHLPERERLIMTLYYRQCLTMKQIAGRLAVDESRVSQLHAEALERLKTLLQASLRPPRQALLTPSVRSSASSASAPV